MTVLPLSLMRCAMVCLLFLLSLQGTTAGKDKDVDTKQPTTAPAPTIAPISVAPTESASPTTYQSISPAPTARPTRRTIVVPLPPMTFTLATKKDFRAADLDRTMRFYLHDQLERGDFRDSFAFIRLSSTLTTSVSNSTKVTLEESTAHYEPGYDRYPTPDQLTVWLSFHFAENGGEELQEYLTDEGFAVTDLTGLTVGNRTIATPTAPPTTAPTVSPRPTHGPSAAPTVEPSASPTKTPAPTVTSAPTKLTPTTAPSVSPQPTSRPSGPTVTVALPELAFDWATARRRWQQRMLQQEQQGSSAAVIPLTTESANEAMEEFLGEYLATGLYKDAFAFVTLNTILADDNSNTNDNGDDTTEVTVRDGQAHFDSTRPPIPTESELSDVLGTYFSFWGERNLQAFLNERGLGVTDVSNVQLDGIVLENLAQSNGDGDSNNGGGDASRGTANQEADSLTAKSNSEAIDKSAIAGIVIGSIAVLAAIAIFVHVRRKQQELHPRNRSARKTVGKNFDKNEIAPKPTMMGASGSSTSSPDGPGSPGGIFQQTPPPQDSDSDAEHIIDRAMHAPIVYPSGHLQHHVPDSPFDIGNDATSDGDIVSVTESLQYQLDGSLSPVRNRGGLSATTTPTSALPTTPTPNPTNGHRNGKMSARPVSADASMPATEQQQTSLPYDSNGLDQVLNQGK